MQSEGVVIIRPYLDFRQRLKKPVIKVKIPKEGLPLEEVIKILGISPQEVGVCMRNKKHLLLKDKVFPQEEISIFPIVGGG